MRIISILIFFFGSLSYAAPNHGIVRVVSGSVKIKSAKSGATNVLRLDQEVVERDTVITGADGFTKIIMDDNNGFSVGPNTTLEIQTYIHADAKKEAVFHLLSGRVRFDVQQHYTGEERFWVTTPASAAGVRGTDFSVAFDASTSSSTITTYKGVVEFGRPGAGGKILDPVQVSAGQRSVMSGSTQPKAPEHLTPEKLHESERMDPVDRSKHDKKERRKK